MNKRFRCAVCLWLCVLIVVSFAGCLSRKPAADFSGEAKALSVGSPCKHYFELLSDTEKHAYNAILSVISQFPSTIEVPSMTREELSRMYTALLYDNPELFFLENASSLRQSQKRTFFVPAYRMSAQDYAAMSHKCTETAAPILQEARSKATDLERERVVHDRIIAMCSYTDSSAAAYKNTVYGVLAGGSAACEGYAKTAKYLLDQLSIPCYVVSGTSTPPGSRSDSHMWNIVQLNGEYYHLDLTWDDPVPEKGGDLVRYTYFNVTDDVIRRTHSDFDAGCICTATQDNFLVHEGLLFTEFGDAEKQRAADFAAQTLSLGSIGFQLSFADDVSYQNAQTQLFDREEIYGLLKQIAEKTDRTIATDRVSYYNLDTDRSIEILVEEPEKEPSRAEESTESGETNSDGYAED